MKYKYPIVTCYTSWCGLGFIRGIKSYNYNYTYKENKENKKYIYLDSMYNGFFGILMYANIALFPYLIYKELYRLEVNIRNLENEKKSKLYIDII